jgi:hypothetical protein
VIADRKAVGMSMSAPSLKLPGPSRHEDGKLSAM